MKLLPESSVSDSIIAQPEDIDVIKAEARKLIKNAGAAGIFPTPIEKLLAAANVTELDNLEEAHKSFLAVASEETKNLFNRAINKVRGFADLKRRINYIAAESKSGRKNWVKLHELGHQQLPWQKPAMYIDDDRSLSPECEEQFEREANAFAGDLLFQGDVFKQVSSSLRPDFRSIFQLASQFGSTNHCAARQLAVESDEAIALVSYYRSKYQFSDKGSRILVLGRAHSASEKFLERYPLLKIPGWMTTDHTWAAALNSLEIVSGAAQFDCGDGTSANFMWEAWWNGYNLLVLIRKTPRLRAIGKMLDV